ncbi:MAG: GH92 family glycosyl hydrolase [Clostridia bacterium]|nr:GH92 family glycosyl hydrolase [Clostridia bacterium]
MIKRKGLLKMAIASGLLLPLAGCNVTTTPSGSVVPVIPTHEIQTQIPDLVDVKYITSQNAIDYADGKSVLWYTSFEQEDGFIGRIDRADGIGKYQDLTLRDGDLVHLINKDATDASPIGAPDGSIDNLFDASTSSKYITMKNPNQYDPVYVTMPLKEPAAVNWYCITSGNDVPNRDPFTWQLLGSNDGASWDVLHKVNGYIFPNREETHLFNFENDSPYSYYKLEILETGEDAYTQMGGLRIGRGSGNYPIEGSNASVTPSLPFKGDLQNACFDITLDAPEAINRYSITSGNESATTDPMYWSFYASENGTDWTLLHEQDMVSFDTRGHEYIVDIDNTASYKYYRLRVDKASLGSTVHVNGITLYRVEREEGDPTLSISEGPGSVWGSVSLKGWSGSSALMLAGIQIGEKAYAEATLYDGLSVKVDSDTYLSYKILPDYVTEYDHEYTSQYMALDLVFTDGSRLSELGATDQYGFPLTASKQGASKVMYTKTWNEVLCNIGEVASGKTIKSILVIYDKQHNGNPGASMFRSYFDDISIYTEKQSVTALADHVDTTRGTYPNTHVFAPTRGNLAPITAYPNGFNHFTPVNRPNSARVYSYHLEGSAKKMYHLSLTHFPNNVLGDYAEYSFMVNNTIPRDKLTSTTISQENRGAEFSHDNEISKAHYYKATFDQGSAASNCTIEVVPTMYAAKLRFTFPKDSLERTIIFDSPRGYGSITFNEDGTFEGRSYMTQSGLYYGDSGARRMYFYGYVDQKVAFSKSFGKNGVMCFDDDVDSVVLTVATSFISLDQAKKNLDLDIHPTDTFEDVACRAKQAWESILGRIRVEDATPDQYTTFYSSLYRMYLYPATYHENVGTAQNPEYAYSSPYEGSSIEPVVKSGMLYVGNVAWDTYRNVWQGYSLFTPSLASKYAQGLLEHYRQSGWTPMATVPRNIASMNAGCENILADLALKGVELDHETAYEALLKEINGYSNGELGRSAFSNYPYVGSTNASYALEYSIADYAISQYARMLGKTDDAEYLLNRSKMYYKSYCQTKDGGFFLNTSTPGVNPWGDSFDPASWSYGYVEASAWHMFAYATHDINGMISLHGGKESFAAQLDEMFTSNNTINYCYDPTWAYMIEARECKMGKYNHGNQPSHSIAYMYNYAGVPSKTQKYVREILSRLYCGANMGGGYPGDDDCGEMSAWYVFSALGFYPVEMANNNFIIGSPLFKRVTITLENGKTVTITAENNSHENLYIQGLKVNGEEHDKFYLDYQTLLNGGTLEFVMGSEPSDWATAETSAPATSATSAGEMPSMQTDLLASTNVLCEGFNAPKRLIDNNRSTGSSECTSGSGSIIASFDSPVSVSFITLTCSVGTAPSGFELLGSNDGEGWISIERRTDLDFTHDLYLRSFKVNSDEAYTSYKLVLSSDAPFQVAEIELIG